jgi:hypothetical protein
MFAVMMAVSVGVTLLDAHELGSEPHFDAPQHPACSPYDHNHSLCTFLAASPGLGTVPVLPALARVPEVTLRPVEADAPFAAGITILTRSRAPPTS